MQRTADILNFCRTIQNAVTNHWRDDDDSPAGLKHCVFTGTRGLLQIAELIADIEATDDAYTCDYYHKLSDESAIQVLTAIAILEDDDLFKVIEDDDLKVIPCILGMMFKALRPELFENDDVLRGEHEVLADHLPSGYEHLPAQLERWEETVRKYEAARK